MIWSAFAQSFISRSRHNCSLPSLLNTYSAFFVSSRKDYKLKLVYENKGNSLCLFKLISQLTDLPVTQLNPRLSPQEFSNYFITQSNTIQRSIPTSPDCGTLPPQLPSSTQFLFPTTPDEMASLFRSSKKPSLLLTSFSLVSPLLFFPLFHPTLRTIIIPPSPWNSRS